MEPEFIRDKNGHIIAEIRQEGGAFLVWRRDPPSFPPRSRHSFLGEAKSIEDARRLAKKLLG